MGLFTSGKMIDEAACYQTPVLTFPAGLYVGKIFSEYTVCDSIININTLIMQYKISDSCINLINTTPAGYMIL
jgi:hypothetical protein